MKADEVIVAREPALAASVTAAPLPPRAWVAIVGNPFSGAGRNRAEVQKVVSALDREGLETRIVWDRDARRSLLHHPELAAHCRCVVVAGGDGTVADVINELSTDAACAPDVPLAVMPLGNENLLARELGFTAGAAALARAIAAGRWGCLDLGCARSLAGNAQGAASGGWRRFSLVLSVGVDAEVVHRLACWRAAHPAGGLRRVRYASYLRPLLGALCHYPYPLLELEADGRHVRGAGAMVFNLPRYGLGLPFAPGAVGDDGLLDWVVLERPGTIASMSYALSVVRGRHTTRRDVHHGRASRLTIAAAAPAPVQMDGDPAGATPIEVGVVPQAIRVVLT